MPCKNEAARLVDELSPAARIIGAVNTIVNEDGKLVGHITDGTGFVQNLKEHGVEVKGKKMVVLGAGEQLQPFRYSAPLTELLLFLFLILMIRFLRELIRQRRS